MTEESYNLQDVAEMLGISRRALHKRLREGVFPERFLAQGRHGLETRIPARDVEAALHQLRVEASSRPERAVLGLSVRPPESSGEQTTDTPTTLPVQRMEALPERVDVQRLKDALIALVREDREQMLRVLRSALSARDDEVHGLRTQLVEVHRAVERLRERIEGWELTMTASSRVDGALGIPAAASPGEDLVDQLLRELAELEGLVEHRS